MINRKTGILCFRLFFAALLLSASVGLAIASTTVQPSKTADASDLSNVSWDDEGNTDSDSTAKDEDLTTDKNSAGNLINQNWDDEESSDTFTEMEDSLQTMNKEDIKALDSKERLIHISGFILFIGYILGGILTAFITRNRKIAVAYPPELLILLHTVWPLELLLVPFGGKPVR